MKLQEAKKLFEDAKVDIRHEGRVMWKGSDRASLIFGKAKCVFMSVTPVAEGDYRVEMLGCKTPTTGASDLDVLDRYWADDASGQDIAIFINDYLE